MRKSMIAVLAASSLGLGACTSVDDARMSALADEIARRIEAELQYPGQIKVVIIRETRATDVAR